MAGGEARNRTGDARIFSPALYQLSYLAGEGGCRGRCHAGKTGGATRVARNRAFGDCRRHCSD